MASVALAGAVAAAGGLGGAGCKAKDDPTKDGIVSLSSPAHANAGGLVLDPATEPVATGARLGADAMVALLYLMADGRSPRLGDHRAEATVVHAGKPAAFDDCARG